MKLKVFVTILLSLVIVEFDGFSQITERERPKGWNSLVFGGRFMDRFLPMPVQGELVYETWGADNVIPRYIDNGLEDNKYSYWGGNAKLGNDGHFGFGPFIRVQSNLGHFIKLPWARTISLCNRISLEYLTPSHNKRCYIALNNNEEFDMHDFDDPDQADENLLFLEEEFIKKLYLVGFDTKIQPGLIFHWLSRFAYEGTKWGFYAGTDSWIQGRDKFGAVQVRGRLAQRIDRCKARGFLSYLGTIFGGITRKVNRPDRSWLISLNGNGAFSSVGIGGRVGLSLNVEAQF